MIPSLYKIFQPWSDYGTVWVYSDTHFDDKDMLKHFNYPSAEKHVQMINKYVGKHDTLILLGDVGNEEWVKQLRGYKVLIKGNHDKGCSCYERKIEYKKINDEEEYPGYRISFITNNLYEADNQLFDEVYEGPLMIGPKLILSHEPIDVPWAFNIHGHDHSGSKGGKNHLNVCANVVQYRPVSLNQFIKSGALKQIDSIHRITINEATERRKA